MVIENWSHQLGPPIMTENIRGIWMEKFRSNLRLAVKLSQLKSTEVWLGYY